MLKRTTSFSKITSPRMRRTSKISALSFKNTINHQGWLTKCGKVIKNWKHRYFVLNDNMLYYYKTDKASQPAGCINMYKTTIEKIPQNNPEKQLPEKYGMKITTEFRVFYLCSNDEQTISDWISVLTKASQLSHEDLKTQAKQCGYLTKSGGKIKTWKRRWFILRNDMLYYHENDDESSFNESPKGVINLHGGTVTHLEPIQVDKKNVKYMFRLALNHRIFDMWTTTIELCDEWVFNILQSTISASTAVKPIRLTTEDAAKPNIISETIKKEVDRLKQEKEPLIIKIILPKGTFTEALHITQLHTLEIEGQEDTILTTAIMPTIMIECSTNVRIKNLKIHNKNMTDSIKVLKGNVVFEKCSIINNAYGNGIRISGDSACYLSETSIEGNPRGGVLVEENGLCILKRSKVQAEVPLKKQENALYRLYNTTIAQL